MIAKRRLRLGLLSLAAAAGGVVLIMILLQAFSRPALRWRVDLSSGGTAALSDRTAEALAALPEGSEAVAFLFQEERRLEENGSAVYATAFGRLRTLLEDARIRSRGRLGVTVVGVRSSPVEQQAQLQRSRRQPLETLILTTPGGGRRALRFHELFVTSDPTPEGMPARILQERVDTALGDAALRLANQTAPRAGIVGGYGQPAESELMGLLQLLHGEGIDPVSIRGPASDKDFDLLVVVGQQRQFLETDAQAARAWVNAGRPLFLVLGPRAPQAVVDFWNGILEPDHGLRFGAGVVCDARPQAKVYEGTNLVASLELTAAQFATQHPATAHLAESTRLQGVIFCRPIELAGGGVDFARTALASSGARAWADLDQDFAVGPQERRGRQILAASAERWEAADPALSGRVVAYGSPEGLIRYLPLARDFIAPLFRWLLRIETPMGLVAVESLPFRPARAEQIRMTNIAVIAMPGLPLMIALLVFLRRRR